MLLQIQDGTLSIGAQTVLAHFDFEIRGNEKIAIVGRNGCGKTTLLRLLAGELSLDRDDHSKAQGILTSRSLTTGLLWQPRSCRHPALWWSASASPCPEGLRSA